MPWPPLPWPRDWACRHVVTILEGEGLVNDATALVLLATALGVATGGARFSGVAAVGVFFGAVIGALVVGNLGRFQIAAAFRATENATWSTVGRIVENGVFLLMGLALPPVVWTVHVGAPSLSQTLLVALLITAVLIALRFAFMPLLLLSIRGRRGAMRRKLDRGGRLLDRFDAAMVDDDTLNGRLDRFRLRMERSANDLAAERDQSLGWRDGTVLAWAGMRGVVTVAAAQTVPTDSPESTALVLIAFFVAIVTLMLSGFTLAPLVTALKLRRDSDGEVQQLFAALHRELKEAGDRAVREAAAEMRNVSESVLEGLAASSESVVQHAEDFSHADFDDEDDQTAQILTLRRIELAAQRQALRRASSVAAYPSEVVGRMVRVLDGEDMQMRYNHE